MTQSLEEVTVTQHAYHRWLERVDPTGSTQDIVQMFRISDPIPPVAPQHADVARRRYRDRSHFVEFVAKIEKGCYVIITIMCRSKVTGQPVGRFLSQAAFQES